jgi:hypothetical protein
MRRFLLLVGLVGVLGAASAPRWLGVEPSAPVEDAAVLYDPDTYAQQLRQCLAAGRSALVLACSERAMTTLTGANTAEVVRFNAETFAQSRVIACHGVMHALGRSLATVVLASPDEQLGGLWAPCAKGMLHGVFENLPLERQGAAEAAFAYCSRPEFLNENTYRGECLHAAGHSVYKAHGNDVVAPRQRLLLRHGEHERTQHVDERLLHLGRLHVVSHRTVQELGDVAR